MSKLVTTNSNWLILLPLVSLYLASCATPSPKLVAVECPKVLINPELLTPARRSELLRLQTLLAEPPPSVGTTPTN